MPVKITDVIMTDEFIMPAIWRADNERDMSISVREDIIMDFNDALQKISLAAGFSADVNYTGIWRIDAMMDGEQPGNIIFDTESEEDDNGNRIVHKMQLTIAHTDAQGKLTSMELNKGMSDVLAVIGMIELKLINKYRLPHKLKLLSTTKGLDSQNKTYGEFDAVIEIMYVTERWKL